MKLSCDMALLLVWFLGLISLALFSGSLWLIWMGLHLSGSGASNSLLFLITGLGLLAWSLFGRHIVVRLLTRSPEQGEADWRPLPPGTVHRLTRPDGSSLHVTSYGPSNAPALIFTHGWELNSAEWTYAQRAFSGQYRVLIWDLPGLGQSRGPQDHDYSLERMAEHLRAVIELAGKQPVVLCGHSIGGMITLTLAREVPHLFLDQVAGVVLTHSTPVNPLRTTWGAPLLRPLQDVLIRPLGHLTIGTWPLARMMNELTYRNGLKSWSDHVFQFAGTETRAQLDFQSRSSTRAHPAVAARGMLGMLKNDVLDVLPGLAMPVLVVTGRQDKVTLPQASEWMVQGLSDATHVTLSPGGHLGLLEQHEAWVQAVDAFMQRCLELGTPAQDEAALLLTRTT